MSKKEQKERMYKLQEFLDFFGRLDNPFTKKSLQGYNKGITYLKKKYPNEYDSFMQELENKWYIKQSPNDTHMELTRDGQIFIDNGGFIKLRGNGNNNGTKNNLSQTLWFKVGLLFANGEMDKLLKEHKYNYTAIARALGNYSYRPYISETVSGTVTWDKNIYSNPTKVKNIFDYCIANRITVTAAFKSHLQQD